MHSVAVVQVEAVMNDFVRLNPQPGIGDEEEGAMYDLVGSDDEHYQEEGLPQQGENCWAC